MRVLATIIVPPHLAVSGGARAGVLLSQSLARHCQLTVASMMSGETEALGAPVARVLQARVRTWLPPLVPWSRLPNHYKTLFYRSDLPNLITRGGYDIVHIHNPMPALEMERVAGACRATGTPYVVSTHGFNEVANGKEVYKFGPIRRQIWDRFVQKPVARVVSGASGVFALSPADHQIIRNMGFKGHELSVVPNGVPIPAPADPSADAAILRRFGIPIERVDGEIACMFLANHTPNKGLPILLEAFTRIQRPFLLVVGGEKRPDIDYDAYIRSCRPGQRIVVTGRLTDDAVAALFRRSNLFVFPTLADTFPLVVLEAMSHGVPVLASKVGGIPYQIASGCGMTVEPGDVEELRRAVIRMGEDPIGLGRMGRRAREHVLANFTWEGAAAAALAGYRRVLRAAPRVISDVERSFGIRSAQKSVSG